MIDKPPTFVLNKHTGALLWFGQTQYIFVNGESPEDIENLYTKVQMHNKIWGWWSLVSIFFNPLTLYLNSRHYKKYVDDWYEWAERQHS